MGGVLKIVFVILGSIIGAGFASGQEIKVFFGVYGALGLVGIIISSCLIGILIYKSLRIIKNNDIHNYSTFLQTILKRNTVLFESLKNIVNVFLIFCFFIMSMGFTTCLAQQFSIPRLIGGIIFSIISYITFIGNINRIIRINQYIMPILIAFIIYAGIKTGIEGGIKIPVESTLKFIPDCIFYASYNILTLIPILIPLKCEIKERKNVWEIAFIAFFVIFISALAVFIIVSVEKINSSEIYMIEIAKQWGVISSVIYSTVILLAIYTSAICSGYGFAKNVVKTEKQYNILIITMCILIIPISNLNFSSTLQTIYPIFGILGLIEILYIIKY